MGVAQNDAMTLRFQIISYIECDYALVSSAKHPHQGAINTKVYIKITSIIQIV